ncbi:hypothetical protein Nepgr_008253 [Nepenthes gracilis]|uniref:Uncharacterized protein n=1 Tax=Nepenthes gracilis TaxID=150966 RepID=A0AAD3S8M7_NEPGR|nr:hypothetical protein Nepgr_008253 [Nepenthes gracilis]
MLSKIRLATGRTSTLECSALVEVEYLETPKLPQGCAKDVLFRDRVGGDQQMTSAYSSPEDSRSSLTRDLASSDVDDEPLLNPITSTSSIIHLSPDGKDGDSASYPLNVEGLQGHGFFPVVASISFADILKRGILSKEVVEPGTCGAHQLPITDVDRLEVLGDSFCREGIVESHASGFAINSLEVLMETEQLGLPVLNRQLGHSY